MKTKAIVQAMHTGVPVRVQDVVSRMEYPGRVTAIIIRKGKKRKIDISAEVTDPCGRSVMIVRPENIVLESPLSPPVGRTALPKGEPRA
jgi:hypothetical protein